MPGTWFDRMGNCDEAPLRLRPGECVGIEVRGWGSIKEPPPRRQRNAGLT